MQLGRNEPCWCGSGLKYKNCHLAFDEKIESFKSRGCKVPDHSIIKTKEQIDGIRESGKRNIAILDYVAEHIREGISTQEIDDWVARITKEKGGICATLGYEGFPRNCCTSINDQVCHGIPSEEDILEDGDIVNVDCTTIYDGYYADSSTNFLTLGSTSPIINILEESA